MLSQEGEFQEQDFSQVKGSRQCWGGITLLAGMGQVPGGSPAASEPAWRAGDLSAGIRGHGDTLSGCSALGGCPSTTPTAWGQDWVAVPCLHRGSLAQGWHLHPTQPWPREVLRGHSLSPVFQPKVWGHLRGMPHPLAPLSPSLPPHGPLRAWRGWVGGGCSQGWVLRLCHWLQVLGLEVWEQVSAGIPLPRVCRDKEGGSMPGRAALWRAAGSAMRLALSHTVSPPRGMLRGRMALTPLHMLSPRTRGWSKTSQTR